MRFVRLIQSIATVSSITVVLKFLCSFRIEAFAFDVLKAGVKNGMLFGKARQLCPDLIPVPYDFEGYKEVSQQLYDTVGRSTVLLYLL